MSTLFLAGLLALGAGGAQAEPESPRITLNMQGDSVADREQFRNLMTCLAEVRPRWGRRTLAEPYLSTRQEQTAQEILRGRDTCLTGAVSQMTYRTSSIVAALAEHYLRQDLPRADFARVSRALATVEPRNVSEDFALCVAARNPVAARTLALSAFGSTAETQAAQQLATHVSDCTNPGESLTVDAQALRALSAAALYRSVTQVMGRN